MTLEEFNESFYVLLDYYPNTKASEELLNVYFIGLAELSAAELDYAVGRIVKEYEGDFLPKVSLILKYAKNMDSEKQIILAKKMLRTAILKCGNSGMVNFEDKGVHAVVDFVGWRRLCTMTTEEFENFLKWEFDGIYKGFTQNPYETNDYYTGSYQIIGQKGPRMITYESIGVNKQNLKFIPLEYEKVQQIGINSDLEKVRGKMLIGVKK